MRAFVLRLAALMLFALFAGQALADDWNVVRLRGSVVQLIDGTWQPLARGSVVPDSRIVRTMGNGHATLTRGNETIELAANTQIQIYDQGGKKPFTKVVEHFGTVAIEAEVRNVQHFAVENRYLAAVVKGTRFTVSAGRSAGTVEVQRGHVQVDSAADHSTTLLAVGQQAKVQKAGMTVSGEGKLPTVLKRGGKAGSSGKPAADKLAAATAAVEQAVADLEQAKTTGDVKAIADAQDALEDLAEDAVNLAKDVAKTDDKMVAKAAADAAKAAEKAVREAEKAAEKATKDQAKASEDAAKAAEKAAEEARKAAEKAAKESEKAAKDAEKDDKSGKGGGGDDDDDNSGSGGDHSGKGKGKGKGKGGPD